MFVWIFLHTYFRNRFKVGFLRFEDPIDDSYFKSFSAFRICRMILLKGSSMLILLAADVSKNGQSNSRASATPSIVETTRSLNKSNLFATITRGMCSPLRKRFNVWICFPVSYTHLTLPTKA